MEVSSETKKALLSDNCHKSFHITIDNIININNEQIVAKTLKIKEGILSGSKFEIIGCIASQMEVTVYNVPDELKDKKITVWMQVDGIVDAIQLFHGTIDSATKQNDRRFKKIIAYDDFYYKANIDVSDWYNSFNYPVRLHIFRGSLLNKLGISALTQHDLPNDNLLFDGSAFHFEDLNGLKLLKSICQIQGGFGIINRSGLFEIRIVNAIDSDLPYPSITTYPSLTKFPSDGKTLNSIETADNPLDYYEEVEFEDFKVTPINHLTIRDDAESLGVTVSDGNSNKGQYIIQGNIFTFGKDANFCREVALNIYNKIKKFSYTPYTAKISGTPYLECGLDAISLRVRDGNKVVPKTFHILNRTLSGDQYMKDTVSAKGDEETTRFISEIGLGLSRMRQNDINGNLSKRIDEIDTDGLKAKSVTSIPSSWDKNTIYFIVK